VTSDILIPALSDADKAAALRDVAGLPLIRRVLLGVRKAGFDAATVLTHGEDDELRSALAGTQVRAIELKAWADSQADSPVLVLPPDFLPSASMLKQAREQSGSEDAHHLGHHAVYASPSHLKALAPDLSVSASAEDFVATLGGTGSEHGSEDGMVIASDGDRQKAEAGLLAGLVKNTEGFMSRHINRQISLAVTKRLMHTNITPNHMTWVSMVLGLAGAAFFLLPSREAHVLGAALFLLHSILDGCDGELARLKFMESRYGGVLDFWSDNVVHVAVFACMGLGLGLHQGATWPLLFAATAVIGTIASAWMVFNHTMRKPKGDGPLYTSVSTGESKSVIVRIADMLSRRDFIYLVLILAIFGKLHWFLIATGIGAPIYALVLTGIVLRDIRNAS